MNSAAESKAWNSSVALWDLGKVALKEVTDAQTRMQGLAKEPAEETEGEPAEPVIEEQNAEEQPQQQGSPPHITQAASYSPPPGSIYMAKQAAAAAAVAVRAASKATSLAAAAADAASAPPTRLSPPACASASCVPAATFRPTTSADSSADSSARADLQSNQQAVVRSLESETRAIERALQGVEQTIDEVIDETFEQRECGGPADPSTPVRWVPSFRHPLPHTRPAACGEFSPTLSLHVSSSPSRPRCLFLHVHLRFSTLTPVLCTAAPSFPLTSPQALLRLPRQRQPGGV